MTMRGHKAGRRSGLFAAGAGLFAGLVVAALTTPVAAQLLPRSFFDTIPSPGHPARIEANSLSYDANADVITASGSVSMRYDGYQLLCDSLRYAQGSGDLLCVGNAKLTSPEGDVMQGDKLDVTGGMKEAFIQSLTITTSSGARITARDAHYSETLQNILNEGTYAPCGECIDDRGRKIGWSIKSREVIQDATTKRVTLKDSELMVLGVPIAWVPWMSLPDPTQQRQTGFLMPTVSTSSQNGLTVAVPYFLALDEDSSFLFQPQLVSRQGVLLGGTYKRDFDNGTVTLNASGIYQLDPEAYDSEVGNRRWRGALQSTGTFVPAESWTVGWSYTAFSDAAYLDDYDAADSSVNASEVFATKLTDDTYIDARIQQYFVIGDYTAADERMQALALPNARIDHYINDDGIGQIYLSASLLGVSRQNRSTDTVNGVPYVYGYEGERTHVTGEATWQRQFEIGPLAVTPLFGLRVDGASYDGTAPVDSQRWTLTPLAAVDVRAPFISTGPDVSQIIEPIAQLVYRGSDVSEVGIVNDNAHSFILDDSNLFSYNRFSGTDRQETGLRANIAARYMANFADGRWMELLIGQSYLIAGTNAFTGDEVQTGTDSGLSDESSNIVIGARGAPLDDLLVGAKLQIDGSDGQVALAAIGGDVTVAKDTTVGADYLFVAARPDAGIANDQHEVTVRASAPIGIDYWNAKASLSWDLAQNKWLETTGQLVYDDGYVEAGAYASATGPTHTNPDHWAVGVIFKLKGPDGKDIF